MKNDTCVISDNCFPKPFTREPRRNCKRNTSVFYELLENRIKQWLPTILAGVGIGTTVLSGIYFFLFQLAEHGF